MANGKLSHEAFITNAIKALRKDGNKGIHTVSSGFIVGFKKYYGGEDPMPIIDTLAAEGKLELRAEGNGHVIYFAGEAPVAPLPETEPLAQPAPAPEPAALPPAPAPIDEAAPAPPTGQALVAPDAASVPEPETSLVQADVQIELAEEIPGDSAAIEAGVEAEADEASAEVAVSVEEEPVEAQAEDELIGTQTAKEAPEGPEEHETAKPSRASRKKSGKSSMNIAVQQIKSTEEHIVSTVRPSGLSIPDLEVAQILQEVEVFTTRADETPLQAAPPAQNQDKKKAAQPERKSERWAFRGVSGSFNAEQLTLFSQEAARILKEKHGVLTEWARLHAGSEFHVELNAGSRRIQVIYITQRTHPSTGYRYIQVLAYVAPARDEALKALLRENSHSDFEWACLMEHCGDEYIALKGVLEYERCNPASMADAVLFIARQASLLDLKLTSAE